MNIQLLETNKYIKENRNGEEYIEFAKKMKMDFTILTLKTDDLNVTEYIFDLELPTVQS